MGIVRTTKAKIHTSENFKICFLPKFNPIHFIIYINELTKRAINENKLIRFYYNPNYGEKGFMIVRPYELGAFVINGYCETLNKKRVFFFNFISNLEIIDSES